MALSGWGKYPVPESGEAADVPADLMQLVEAMDAHTVLFATSVANRNALYSGVPAGALVVCAALKTVWLSLGSSVWHTVASDTGWVTLGFSYPSSDWDDGGTSRVRSRNGVTEARLSVVRSGSTLTAAADGGLGDVIIAQLPASYAPIGGRVSGCGFINGTFMSFYVSSPTGSVVITNTSPGAVFAAGITLTLSATWLEG